MQFFLTRAIVQLSLTPAIIVLPKNSWEYVSRRSVVLNPTTKRPEEVQPKSFEMAHFMNWVVEALQKYPSRTIFKGLTGSQASPAWVSISYTTFLQDVERSAAHWSHTFTVNCLRQTDVVGLW
jgi:hypothetical protein